MRKMSAGARACFLVGVALIFLLGIARKPLDGVASWMVSGGIACGLLVPFWEASIRGGFLRPPRWTAYLVAAFIPPLPSVTVFLVMGDAARAFALTAFATWLLATALLMLAVPDRP